MKAEGQRERVQEIRIGKARKGVLTAILELLSLVGLPQEGVEGHISDFLVAYSGGQLVGSVGLEVYEEVGLLRSLAIHPSFQGRGLGKRLTEEILSYAREKGLAELYLLTTTAQGFFERFGFIPIPREEADGRVKVSVEFQSACPETAICMKLELSAVRSLGPTSSSGP